MNQIGSIMRQGKILNGLFLNLRCVGEFKKGLNEVSLNIQRMRKDKISIIGLKIVIPE